MIKNKEKDVDVEKLIDEISNKFNYDEELCNTLKRIVPAMTDGKSKEITNLLYDSLQRVKIFVLDNKATKENVEECRKQVMKNNNSGVNFIDEDRGEYGKGVGAGAYVSEPIFDENMNIVDRGSYIYISKLNENSRIKDVYGTSINISHLIHELGHAWASQKDEFIQKSNGEYINTTGAYSSVRKVDRDKKEDMPVNYTGLLIEEALNTIEEENVLCKVLEIDKIDDLKDKGYIKSNYQGLISDMMKSYVEKFGSEAFDKFRFLKDGTQLEKINSCLRDTEYFENIKTIDYMENKMDIFSQVKELDVSDESKKRILNFVSEYKDDYFADNSKFSPIEKLENVFTQLYNLKDIKYNFGNVDENQNNKGIYSEIMISILKEGYAMKNQSKEIEDKTKENSFKEDLKENVNKETPNNNSNVGEPQLNSKEKEIEPER